MTAFKSDFAKWPGFPTSNCVEIRCRLALQHRIKFLERITVVIQRNSNRPEVHKSYISLRWLDSQVHI